MHYLEDHMTLQQKHNRDFGFTPDTLKEAQETMPNLKVMIKVKASDKGDFRKLVPVTEVYDHVCNGYISEVWNPAWN